ncbi:DNA polymerase II [Pokkaliibacter sp. CJK22405]|uniref:DNA polymerase II n=1 Tax=Pokkaliibacter sp. CJK22405 TaxID=3384615 RepID=UPI003984F82B
MSSFELIQGWILTRSSSDVSGKLMLEYWLRREQRCWCWRVTDQEAVFFFRSQDELAVKQALSSHKDWRVEPLSLKDFDGNAVSGCYFRSLAGWYRGREALKSAGIEMMEEDIRPQDRFLMERNIRFGVEVLVEGVADSAQFPYFYSSRARPATIQADVRWLSLDIETTMDAKRLFSIGLHMQNDDTLLVLRDAPERFQPPEEATVEWFSDEGSLLLRLNEYLCQQDPDAILGWNIVGFDISVLQRCYQRQKIPMLWGRDDHELNLRQRQSGQMAFLDIGGRIVLDGIDTLRGATWHFESFSLNYVSSQLLGRKKLIHEDEERGQEISRLFHEDIEALLAYNLEDCKLVADIFDYAALLPYLVERAELTGLPLDRVGGSQAAFDYLYLPKLHRKGRVAPVYASGNAEVDSPGGFVMSSQPGLYDNVLVFDFKSLYPSIIRTFCIDPLGMVEGLSGDYKKDSLVDGFNGAVFHRQKHLLPDIVAECWKARDHAKEQGNKPLSTAIKIIMNAFYGVLGSPLCRFFDRRLSGSITLRGHEILHLSKEWFERQGLTVIYGDTDSLFVHVGDSIRGEAAVSQGKELAQALNQWWEGQLQSRFQLRSYLEIQFEVHYQRFLMPTIRGSEEGSKKRYAGLVRNEAAQEHRLVFKGLESVRSDWTPFAQRIQRELYERVFLKQPYRSWLRQQVDSLLKGVFDEELVYRKRLRRSMDEYQRNVPPQVQAVRKLAELKQRQGEQWHAERGYRIAYVFTLNGAEPLSHLTAAVDYQRYLDKQLVPVVDSILLFLGDSAEKCLSNQPDLFDQ